MHLRYLLKILNIGIINLEGKQKCKDRRTFEKMGTTMKNWTGLPLVLNSLP